ncbi:hypothetical protein VT84_13645 [Gemmata sp. SH-PL17]|uniref:hypothetical protein n=1 Tax=Gemmata sp. SH-PL17 TaxID=1630693 RepID=UPI00078C7347|nr:hypothetical protein [Gemmata sp. SH-PL17]AMV25440.1 hypothetical protein VT84_13645 [Gemmata sp. SH-PL17]
MNETAIAASAPKTLNTALGAFRVAAPTAADHLDVIEAMRDQAQKQCVSPLAYLNAHLGQINPALVEVATRQALAMGAGGGVAPAPQLIEQQYTTVDGLAWRLTFHIKKLHPDFTDEKAREILKADGRWNTADALDKAIGFGDIDPKKDAPPTGTGS